MIMLMAVGEKFLSHRAPGGLQRSLTEWEYLSENEFLELIDKSNGVYSRGVESLFSQETWWDSRQWCLASRAGKCYTCSNTKKEKALRCTNGEYAGGEGAGGCFRLKRMAGQPRARRNRGGPAGEAPGQASGRRYRK